jgi:hypothetical protein
MDKEELLELAYIKVAQAAELLQKGRRGTVGGRGGGSGQES